MIIHWDEQKRNPRGNPWPFVPERLWPASESSAQMVHKLMIEGRVQKLWNPNQTVSGPKNPNQHFADWKNMFKLRQSHKKSMKLYIRVRFIWSRYIQIYMCVCVYIYSIFALSLSIPFRQGGPSPNHSAGRTWRTITRAGGNPQGTKPNCFSPNGNWPNHKIEGKNGRKPVGNVQRKQLNIEIHRNRWKMMPSSSDLGGWSPDSLVGRRDEAQMKSIFQRLKCLVDGSQLAWRQQEKSSTSGQHLILTFSRDPTKARTHPADILYGAFCIHIK